MQCRSEVEGQKFVKSAGRDFLPSCVGVTVEWSYGLTVDIASDVEEMKAKEMKIQEGLKSLCNLLRWVLRLDERKVEGAVSDRFCDGRSMRWEDRGRHFAKHLS